MNLYLRLTIILSANVFTLSALAGEMHAIAAGRIFPDGYGNAFACAAAGLYTRQKLVKPLQDSTRKTAGDSIKRISLTGEVLVEGRYSETGLPFQSLPNNYVRTAVNAKINAFGLPLQLGVLYSTENNGMHRINGFRIGFSNEELINNMRKTLVANANDERFSLELDSLNSEYTRAQADIQAIDREFALPDYQARLAESAEVIANYELTAPDPGAAPGYRYGESKEFIAGHHGKVKRLGEAQATVRQIEARLREIRVIKQNNLNNLDGEHSVKQLSVKKLPLGYRLAMSVKSFEAGKFTPNYNSLIFEGTSLLGMNMELNPGLLYGAFCFGSLEYLFNASRPGEYVSSQQSVFSPDARVMWVRAGLRNGNRFSVVLNQMMADVDRKNREGADRLQRNTVIGAEISYTNKKHKIRAELAQSNYGSIENYGRTLRSIGKGSEFNYALKGQYQVLLQQSHQVTAGVKSSYIAPDYFSIGVPFMRKDNLKLGVHASGFLLKKILRLEAGLRNEQDNFHRKSAISNNILAYTFSASIRYKSYPSLHFLVSPGSNRMTDLASGKTYRQEFSMYSASTAYSFGTKKVVYTMNLFAGYSTYMQLFASDSISYNRGCQAGGSLLALFKKPAVEVSASLSANTATATAGQFLLDSKVAKHIKRYTTGIGYTQARDAWSNRTRFYYLTLAASWPFDIRLNVKAGYSSVVGNDPVYGMHDRGITSNITLSKRF